MAIMDDPQHCLDFVRDGGWTWFVTLRYPRESDRSVEIDSARDCFRTWIDWLGQNFGSIAFVLAIEKRADDEHLLHVLLRDVPENMREPWRTQWRTITTAGAWDRKLDQGVEGLFRHFFYKGFKLVEMFNGVETQYCNERPEDDDFFAEQSWGI